jgi:predicted alpha/beta hydrolase family esterase
LSPDPAPPPVTLVLPGLNDSGPEHWQSRWETLHPAYRRVGQRDWDHPDLPAWLGALEAAVAGARGPVALVAHSLGCALAVHAAARPFAGSIVAALLVAPADVDSPAHTPAETRGFAPLPMRPLPFPATVVASENDPFVTLPRARAFADAWGAAFVDAGPRGHLNAASGLGDWPEGQQHLAALLARAGSSRRSDYPSGL